MPILRNQMLFETVRNIKVFLNLEAGVTRGSVPVPGLSSPQRKAGQNVRRPKEIPRPQAKGKELPRISSDGGPQKFFLVGHGKSGTSWLMWLLHSHPEILCRGEGKFFGKDSHKSLYNALLSSEELKTWLGRNPWTWQEQDPNLDDLLRVLVNYLMAEKLDKTNKRIVGDKTPLESKEAVEEIATICPGSKVIHIIRDGRDVAVSAVHHRWNSAKDKGGSIGLTPEQAAKREAYREDAGAFGKDGESIFADGEVATAARRWRVVVGNGIRQGIEQLGDDYYQIQYEELLANPAQQIRPVLEFLGVDSREEIVRRCVEAASFEQKSGRKPGEEDPTSFFRKGVAGDWQNVLTREDRQIFKAEAGDLLVELGYEKNNDW